MRAVAQSGERLHLATPDHGAANTSAHERPGVARLSVTIARPALLHTRTPLDDHLHPPQRRDIREGIAPHHDDIRHLAGIERSD